MKPVLAMPEHFAIARVQSLLMKALGDKQDLAFTGEVTVMKFIGG
jgi:cyclic pyranopterin phosphate synthase